MTKPLWAKFEQEAQEALGLNPTIASGAKFWDLGDGSTGHNRLTKIPLIVDCKMTEKKSYSLNSKFLQEWLLKAAELGKMFLLPIRFQHAEVQDYVVIQMDDFLSLYEMANSGL